MQNPKLQTLPDTNKSADLSKDGTYLHIHRMVLRFKQQRPDGIWMPAK